MPLTGLQAVFERFLMAHTEFIESTKKNLEAQTEALEDIRSAIGKLTTEFPSRIEGLADRNRKVTLEASAEILRRLRELGAEGTEPLEVEWRRVLDSLPESAP